MQGLAATSVQWGAWGGGGMAASDAALLARLARVGMGAIRPTHGLAALGAILASVLFYQQSSQRIPAMCSYTIIQKACIACAGGMQQPVVAVAVLLWDWLLVEGRDRSPMFAEFAAQPAVAATMLPGTTPPQVLPPQNIIF